MRRKKKKKRRHISYLYVKLYKLTIYGFCISYYIYKYDGQYEIQCRVGMRSRWAAVGIILSATTVYIGTDTAGRTYNNNNNDNNIANK